MHLKSLNIDRIKREIPTLLILRKEGELMTKLMSIKKNKIENKEAERRMKQLRMIKPLYITSICQFRVNLNHPTHPDIPNHPMFYLHQLNLNVELNLEAPLMFGLGPIPFEMIKS